MTQAQDMKEQAVSYAQHQAKKSLAELAELMERTGEDCARSLEGVSEAQAEFKPVLSDAEGHDEEWSMKEVLEHMLGSSKSINHEIANLAAGKESAPTGQTGLTQKSDRPIGMLSSALADLWIETGRLVASLPQDGNLDATWDHPWFGSFNFKEWIAFQRMHALDHVQQMEKLKLHPAYPRD
ncbi:MAG: DinB family protein [Dehalococcoidia bacterium]